MLKVFALPIHVWISFLFLMSLVKYHREVLECLHRLNRTQLKTDPSSCWRPCSDDASRWSSAKRRPLILQLPAVTPSSRLWLFLQFCNRLRRGVVKTHILAGIQHPLRTVVIQCRRHSWGAAILVGWFSWAEVIQRFVALKDDHLENIL